MELIVSTLVFYLKKSDFFLRLSLVVIKMVVYLHRITAMVW